MASIYIEVTRLTQSPNHFSEPNPMVVRFAGEANFISEGIYRNLGPFQAPYSFKILIELCDYGCDPMIISPSRVCQVLFVRQPFDFASYWLLPEPGRKAALLDIIGEMARKGLEYFSVDCGPLDELYQQVTADGGKLRVALLKGKVFLDRAKEHKAVLWVDCELGAAVVYLVLTNLKNHTEKTLTVCRLQPNFMFVNRYIAKAKWAKGGIFEVWDKDKEVCHSLDINQGKAELRLIARYKSMERLQKALKVANPDVMSLSEAFAFIRKDFSLL